MRDGALPPSHLLLALAVVAIWGTNFVVVKQAMHDFPPLTLGALRFAAAALPLLLMRPPAMPVRAVGAYGVLVGIGQFGLMLYAIDGHISPGLASLLIQTQAVFTIDLAVLIERETLSRRNIAALALCTVGVLAVALHTGGEADVTGILLVLGAALSWAVGNMVVKRAGRVDMLSLVAWSSLIAAPGLLVAALVLEGPEAIVESISHASRGGWLAVAWQAVGNALFGYGAWNWLLARHPAARIAPLGLMVPVFGMTASTLILSEPLPAWKLAATALVLAGLAVNTPIARGGRREFRTRMDRGVQRP